DIHWIASVPPKLPLKCKVRLRHRHELQDCVVSDGLIKFTTPQRAVTPGQFAVLYLSPLLSKNNICLGGGIVK
ncbi:MAG: tRNA 2-thiouridine(34) synthase MnmA, partial [Candidatus Magasanikbacteria bacterium]|nr:tRNA 2-thiouridine(34) synthase MnmA [Candidatus Magasanikbacteria bacterium]